MAIKNFDDSVKLTLYSCPSLYPWILITAGLERGKTNALLNFAYKKPNIDTFFWPKIHLNQSISNSSTEKKKAGIKHLKNSKTFIDY